MNRRLLSVVYVAAVIGVSSFTFDMAAAAKSEMYSLQVSKSYTKIDNLIDQNKFNEAQGICEELLKKNPADINARIHLGNIYSGQYKLEAAERELTRVLEKNPDNAEAHNGLGTVYYKKTTSSDMNVRKNADKYYQSALNEFEKAIQLSPNYYKAYNNAGKIMQEMGKINEAEKYYRKALEIEPKYSEAIENLGTVFYAKNQVNAAIEKYKEAIEINSKNSSAYYHLGEALIAKGDYGKAIKNLQTSLYLFSNSAPVHDMLGRAYEIQGNEAAAITEYKKSILIKPEYSAPYLRLANLYENRGDDEFAISELRSAVSINPNFLEGKLKIAEISLNVGKFEQAIKYYKDVLNDKNYTEPALKGLANAYFRKAQEVNSTAMYTSEFEYIEAEDALKQALQYDPNDIQLYLALLRVSRLTNKDGQSEYYLSKIMNNSVNKPINHVIKGEALITYKKYNDAQIEFENAVKQVDKIEDTLNLGEIFIVNRQYQAAKLAFNKVLSKQPNNLKAARSLERIHRYEEQAIAKMNVAKGFYREGQSMAAIEAFRDCLALNPNISEAQLLLARSFEKEKYYFNALEHYNAYINLADIKVKDSEKYKRKIDRLSVKVQRMQKNGRAIKKFTRI